MNLSDLTPDPNNANKGTERGNSALEASLQQYGAGRSILLDRNDTIIAGNKTAEMAGQLGMMNVKVVETTGDELVAVKRTDLDLETDASAREMAYADNRVGELSLDWDADALLNDTENGIDIGKFWSERELDILFERAVDSEADAEKITHVKLSERFLVPPFSVLDARQGYWQDRKRAWASLGIQSELGRGDTLLAPGENVYNGNSEWAGKRGGKRRPNATPGGSLLPSATLGKDGKTQRGDGRGREMTASYKAQGRLEALQKTGSSYNTEGNISEQTGTSIFDPVLCELMYRWFCPPNGRVLDPFAGGSVRGIVAAKLGRQYVGIDLSERQIEANRAQAGNICKSSDPVPLWVTGDSRTQSPGQGKFDFLFTCPPYVDLEVYSDDEADLSTMPYSEFLSGLSEAIAAGSKRLKNDRFAAIVVGDVRNKKGDYYNFVGDTKQMFLDAGMRLYNDAVLVTAVGSLPLRVGRQFEAGRKLGKTHQNVLVFIKGDAKKATAATGEVDIADDVLENYGEELIREAD